MELARVFQAQFWVSLHSDPVRVCADVQAIYAFASQHGVELEGLGHVMGLPRLFGSSSLFHQRRGGERARALVH